MRSRAPTTACRLSSPPGPARQTPAPPIPTVEKERRKNVAHSACQPRSLPTSYLSIHRSSRNMLNFGTQRCQRAVPP
ncbi:hypothetical protein NDU88_005226 [Pleurodeles waltl]|uniref:Uncharacterized protein n=1 Tax=Pleurodeles waltl TaxID=8319 RepID=A0AAV7UHG7_PLEWA|nr:hypothetical protein NDU88_005226 [Pleurodeles waltl]